MAQAIAYQSRGFQRLTQLPVASAQTFKKGHFLIWTATGVARIAGANAALGGKSATTMIVGRAEEDAQRADGSNKGVVTVMIAEPGTQFMMPLFHTTASSAVPTPATQLGNQNGFGLFNASTMATGGWSAWPDVDACNLAEGTNYKLLIVDYVTEDFPAWPGRITDTAGTVSTPGTVQAARVWIEFFTGVCALTSARPGV